MFYKWLILLFALGVVTSGGLQANSAPEIDNSIWAQVLDQYVDEQGYVDYQLLHKNRIPLDQYVSAIGANGPETSPAQFPTDSHKLAYYINAYNALVFKGVLDRGPEQKSVWSGLISGLNFFVRMKIKVDGNKTNLKDLEDDIVRKQFGDPRIHAALNCASIGCPRLIKQPYQAELLDQQLQTAMIEFLNGSQHIQLDTAKKQVRISMIFDWFEEDFIDYEKAQGNTEGSKNHRLIDYINRFRSPADQIPTDFKVRILDYDKRINSRAF
ncbi:MAG: DUF547 domain-containing protein [Acidiferrobacterales bacterium]|nr:DUF547 domain-containing protein [Acidiferrobacterales bacterium]